MSDISEAQRWIKHFGLRLDRLARRKGEDGQRWTVADPWARIRWTGGLDASEGVEPSGVILERATVAELWAWIDDHEPIHKRCLWDARNAWRQSLDLPTMEALGFEFESDDDDTEPGP